MKNKFLFIVIVLCNMCVLPNTLIAQHKSIIYGTITDEKNQTLEIVNVAILNYPGGTTTNENGFFEISVPSEKDVLIVFSRIGYQTHQKSIYLLPDERKQLNIQMYPSQTQLPQIEISAERNTREGMQKIDPKQSHFVPSASSGLEQLIKLTAMGVSTTSELSSTYSVRGGNYDENLVYVNDIEIYRPFLVRSGQQEGLSFLNSDLAESVFFSSGGFDASYGDKMSSVLDVTYKTPQHFSGSAFASLLGGNIHLEGVSKENKFTYLSGIRYKTNQYLLKSMETKGDYKPQFADIQTYFTYRLSDKTQLSMLNYISFNSFKVVPETRETSYGTINEAYRLQVFFEGQEVDKFSLYKQAVSLSHKPNLYTKLIFNVSGFISQEQETFDILGQYRLGKLETDFGKPGFGDVAENRGFGSFLNNTRNFLTASVINAEHRGQHFKNKTQFQWGFKTQYEHIVDNISEWTYIDSAGYSLPHNKDSIGYKIPSAQPYQYLKLHDTLFSQIEIQSLRYSSYFLGIREFVSDSNKIILNAGIRGQYWTLNEQFVLSPRASLSFKPHKLENYTFRIASGMYYQPPFYRELRNIDGTINKGTKAQQSIHFVAGTDIDLTIWKRPFKFSSELYYKYLNNLIPYIVDNVRIKYLPDMQSKGYATGIDFKINGEFVKGIESWVNLSVMQTQEDIIGDQYLINYNSDGERIIYGYTLNNEIAYSDTIYPGYIPRPTDQRVSFSLFFQDYFPNDPTIKMHLGIFFGSGLPFGPPNTDKFKHLLRMPSYRRVDVGFSKQLISEGGNRPNFFSSIMNAWISVEVLNLLQVNNTISYVWIADVTGRLYAIPNYLTPRQLNVKMMVQF